MNTITLYCLAFPYIGKNSTLAWRGTTNTCRCSVVCYDKSKLYTEIHRQKLQNRD